MKCYEKMKFEECDIVSAISGAGVMEHEKTEHYHAHCYQLLHIVEGNGTLFVSNIPHSLEKGRIYLVFPHDIHRISDDYEHPLKYNCIDFSVNSGRFSSSFSKIRAVGVNGTGRELFDGGISETLEIIFSELEQNDNDYSKELMSLLFSQFLIRIIRSHNNSKRDDEDGVNGNYELCIKTMTYIDTHVYDMKNLKDVAEELGYNYCYLSAVFRKTTGTTLISYYKAKRMGEAKMLLETGGKTVSEIAETLGYSSVYAFSKAFKEYLGISPVGYASAINKKH